MAGGAPGLWSLITVRAAETGGRKGPVFINPAPLGKLFLFAQKQQQLKASPGLFIVSQQTGRPDLPNSDGGLAPGQRGQ